MTRLTGPHIDPLQRSDCAELEPTWQILERLQGYLPNTELTMARMPRSTKVLGELLDAYYSTATLPSELLSLIGLLSSSVAGSQYCMSQNVSKASRDGSPMEKLAAVWDFETSPLFSAAEKAALRLAFKASHSPSDTEKEDFDRALGFFTEREITEIVALVAIFAIFNRFNNSVATTLEEIPRNLGGQYLPPERWQPGGHGSS